MRKLRRGIGYNGRIFQYGTAVGRDGCDTSSKGPVEERVEQTKKLNKLPEFRRAAKRRERRVDLKRGMAEL